MSATPAMTDAWTMPAEPPLYMPAWGDAQIKRFVFREALFRRRGLSAQAAEQLGDRLATRDYQRDDRRVCLECESLQRGGKCFQVQQGNMPNVSPKHEPVADLLQRCDFFSFQKP